MLENRSADPKTVHLWPATRLSTLFLFDTARISAAGGDILEPLILTAVLQANQATLHSRPDLQMRYGSDGDALPDGLRRPISINAVAQSLQLPFETVRRKVGALGQRGLCVASPAGVYVPQAAVTSPDYLAVLKARTARLAALHRDLAAAGFVTPEPQMDRLIAAAPRAADRLLANYMLRACGGLLELTGGAITGVTLLALCAANIRQVEADLRDQNDYAAVAQPCSASALAKSMGLPQETIRRRLLRMAPQGWCRAVDGRWIAAVPEAQRPVLSRIADENVQNLQRLFAAVQALGASAG